MTAHDARSRVLAFAGHVGRGHTEPPEAIARRRNWLDAQGRVTRDGMDLLDALGDQSETRTVFRGNF